MVNWDWITVISELVRQIANLDWTQKSSCRKASPSDMTDQLNVLWSLPTAPAADTTTRCPLLSAEIACQPPAHRTTTAPGGKGWACRGVGSRVHVCGWARGPCRSPTTTCDTWYRTPQGKDAPLPGRCPSQQVCSPHCLHSEDDVIRF